MSTRAPKIVVLVKHVRNIHGVAIDPVTRLADPGEGREMNVFDQFALAAAISLRDQTGGRVTAITVGPVSSHDMLIRCIASGADDAIRIEVEDPNAIDTLALARLLAAEIDSLQADIVISGQTSADYQSGQTGLQVAEILGWPHVSRVTALSLNDTRLSLRRDLDDTREHVAVDLPAVVVVLSRHDSEQRHPTLRSMMLAKKQTIPVASPTLDFENRLTWTEPVSEIREPTGTIVRDKAAPEAARDLVRWLEERKLM